MRRTLELGKVACGVNRNENVSTMVSTPRSQLLMSLMATILLAACTIERGDVRTPSGETPEADTTRVRKAMQAIARGFVTGDLLSLDTLYHDSVLVFAGGSIGRGWVWYRDQLAAEMEVLSERRMLYEDIRVRQSGSTAWATYRFTMEGLHDGNQISVNGLGTMVFQRLSGRWRLAHSHTSAQRFSSRPD